MLSDIVRSICNKAGGYKGCPTCQLYPVCSMPHEEQQGETLAEKTAYWEEQMNKAAEAVGPRSGG